MSVTRSTTRGDPSGGRGSLMRSFLALLRPPRLRIGEPLARIRESLAGSDLSRRSAYLYLLAFAIAITFIVLESTIYFVGNSDTQHFVRAFDKVGRFSSLFSSANANPLEALFDIFPHGYRADLLPNLVWRALGGTEPSLAFYLISSAILLALGIVAMARAVGIRWAVAVLAGILFPMMILPIGSPLPVGPHFYILAVSSYYYTAGALFVTALYWNIDGASKARFWLSTAAIIAILVHLSITLVLFTAVLAPAVFVFGVAALLASQSRRELIAKVAAAALIVVALGASGMLHYAYAIGSDTSFHVFNAEMRDFMLFGAPSWAALRADAISALQFSLDTSVKYEGLIAPVAQAGALYLAVFGRTRNVRLFGRAMCAWILLTILIFFVTHYFFHFTGHVYKGPPGPHYTWILWPYYMICVAAVVLAAIEALVRPAGRFFGGRRIGALVPHALPAAVLGSVVVFVAAAGVANKAPEHRTAGDSPWFVWRNERTPIVDYLEERIAVAVGRPFAGSVVALPTRLTRDARPYGAALRDTSFAFAMHYLGNDMGSFGLWKFGIPTLNQFTENVTPQFHLIVRELLSRPYDAHQKHHTLITRLNAPILQLLGVRFLVADDALPAGVERVSLPFSGVAEQELAHYRAYASPLRLYELPEPNTGNYSPTEVVRAGTARAMIEVMRNAAFDGRRTVVADDDAVAGDLVPATGATMTVERGGVRLGATSAGQSVLVLPIQYSHCWRITSGEATLFRANLMQLGVRFSGDLRLELRQMFGPFWQSGCRLEDVADFERLRLVEAAGAGAEPDKVPGDGVNLIPQPEALDTVMDSNPTASVEAVADPAAPLQAYALAARGGLSDHYVLLPVSGLTPGPYTLSMQVRAGSTSRLAVQLKDKGDQGAIADYLLRAGVAPLYRLGGADRLHAAIETADEGWLRLTLTTTLTAESGWVFLHLGGMRGDFRPNGEGATIRALMLERGETATAYRPAPDLEPEPGPAPGDGINRIPSADALDRAVDRSAIASLDPVGRRDAPVPEYALTARGRVGEHFLGLTVPNLTPGPHTLSLEVRADSAPRLAVQLKDGSDTGVIGDYFVRTRRVRLYPLGDVQAPRATIARIGGGWLRLTLTSDIRTGAARIFFHLRGLQGAFRPDGESTTIRAVRLERSETAAADAPRPAATRSSLAE